MKKILVYMLAGLMMATTVAMAQGRGKAGSEQTQASQPVTHPQLAELLVRALGLVRYLPNASTPQQMFSVLMQNGIAPQDGWKLDAVVTKADLSRVIVQALRGQDSVENPNDPQAWINVLKEMGISIDRLSETIQSVEALPESLAQDITMSSTDPLITGTTFAPSTVQYSVDLNLVVRVLSEMEMVSGEFRPISPTPH
ncbi:MAG: hypothetical protein PHO14_07890 [Kiritimatiellae bacterium]|nr:hypothetical protein [Kiritimatiellia bacterium]MDD4342139.1 hypothetical protein [Kiritimatiellia bacterium]MDY0150157.1 hypothetical protein [Kiritimatiellia bacterium]